MRSALESLRVNIRFHRHPSGHWLGVSHQSAPHFVGWFGVSTKEHKFLCVSHVGSRICG